MIQACKAVQSFGFPVVLKGVARDMVHKTEAGLVSLNISSAQQVKAEFAQLMTAMNNQGRVLVQSQISDDL